MHGIGAACAHFGNRKAFENIQHLQDVHAARTRRRHRHDFVAAVAAAHRLSLGRLVGRERLGVDQTTPRLHRIDDLLGNRPVIESIRPIIGDQFERIRKVSLNKKIARCIGLAAWLVKIAARGGILAQSGLPRFEQTGEIVADCYAITRQCDRGLEQPPPWQLAVELVCMP